METVYLIGNGFDLHHNLPTHYKDFHNYVIANSNHLEDTFLDYFKLRKDLNSLWTNFEEDLCTFNWQSFFDAHNNITIGDDDFRPSFANSLEDDLSEQAGRLKSDINNIFQNWLDAIDISNTKIDVEFLENSTFINFNYTLVLEEIYKIEPSRILHIHGDIKNNSGELVFGHNVPMKEISELDENGDSNRTMFTDAEDASKMLYHSFLKPVEEIINNNVITFDSMSKVKSFYVLGHSLNPIDIPYFKQMYIRSKDAQWNVSYFNNSERLKHLSTLIKIGISPEHIHLFKL